MFIPNIRQALGIVMSKPALSILLSLLFLALPALADTIILHDGTSYSGQFLGASSGEITFSDAQGIQYRFPLSDVQSLVFTASGDTVTLRDGKVYSGHYTGVSPLSFNDTQGIAYQFPVRDVSSVVFTRNHTPAPTANASGGSAKVIPEGTEIAIRTDEKIDSEDSSP